MNYEIKRFDSTFWELNLKERENPELIKLLESVPGISKINKCSDYSYNVHLGKAFDPDLVEKRFKKLLFDYYAFKGAVWKEDPGIKFVIEDTRTRRLEGDLKLAKEKVRDKNLLISDLKENHLSELMDLNKDKAVLYREIDILKGRRQALRAAIDEYKIANRKLKDELDKKESAIAEYRKAHRSDEIDGLKEENAILSKILSREMGSKNLLNEKQVEVACLKAEMADLKQKKARISELIEENNFLYERIDNSKTDIEEFKKQAKRIFGE